MDETGETESEGARTNLNKNRNTANQVMIYECNRHVQTATVIT